MAERGYDLTAHASKSLTEAGAGPWDYVVTMGCGDECPWVPSRATLDWDVPDPRELPEAEFRAVRDEIERRVVELVERIRTEPI
jgi:protein-tyrosine-phosphatase